MRKQSLGKVLAVGMAVWSFTVVMPASASIITVVNNSFEDDDITGFANITPTGWAWVEPSGNSGVVDEDTGLFTAPDGTQVMWLNTGRSLSQTVGATLTAGQTYNLTVAVGTRTGSGSLANTYDIQLKAGGVILAQSTSASLGGGFPFTDVLTTFTATAGHAQLGQALEIVLGGETQILQDNVRLEAIPEPASLALMGLGGLLMLRRRRA